MRLPNMTAPGVRASSGSIRVPAEGRSSRAAPSPTAMRSNRHSSAPFQTVCTRCARRPSSRPSDGSPVSTAACQPPKCPRSTAPSSAWTERAADMSPSRRPQGGLVQSRPTAAPSGRASASGPGSNRVISATPAWEALRRASRMSAASRSRPRSATPSERQRSSPAAALASAASTKDRHSAGSWPGHCKKPKYRRRWLAARPAAMRAASITSVPEPHIGSRKAVPSAASAGQPARSSTPAATFSRSGASPVSPRQPRRCRPSPERSIDTVTLVPTACACTRTPGSRVAMSGRAPVLSRSASQMASLRRSVP